MKRMENKDGQLTAYALLCGYVQKVERDDKTVTLFMEHQHYHVIYFDHETGERDWRTYEINELTIARETFKHFKKIYL